MIIGFLILDTFDHAAPPGPALAFVSAEPFPPILEFRWRIPGPPSRIWATTSPRSAGFSARGAEDLHRYDESGKEAPCRNRSIHAGLVRAATMADVARTLGLSHPDHVARLNDLHRCARTPARGSSRPSRPGYRRNPAPGRWSLGDPRRSACSASTPRCTARPARLAASSTPHRTPDTRQRRDRRGGQVETVRDALERLIAQSVEGIIVIAPLFGTVKVFSAADRSLPIVIVESGTRRPDVGAGRPGRGVPDGHPAPCWRRARSTVWRMADQRAGSRPRPGSGLADGAGPGRRARSGAAAPARRSPSGYEAAAPAPGRSPASRQSTNSATTRWRFGLLRAFHEPDAG